MKRPSFNQILRHSCGVFICLFFLNGCEEVEEDLSENPVSEEESAAGSEVEVTESDSQDSAIEDGEDNEQRRIGCALMCTQYDPCDTPCFYQGNHTTCGGASLPCGQPPPNVFCDRYEGKYISIEDDDGWYPGLNDDGVRVDRTEPYHWRARWKVSCHGDRVAFENNGRYMRGRDGWKGWVDTQSFVGSWEKWLPKLQSDGKWAFRSEHGRYLYSVPSGFRQRNSISGDTVFIITER